VTSIPLAIALRPFFAYWKWKLLGTVTGGCGLYHGSKIQPSHKSGAKTDFFLNPAEFLEPWSVLPRWETESPALFGPTRPSCPPQPARGETSACATERETATQACAKPIRGGRHRLLSRVELGLADGFFFFFATTKFIFSNSNSTSLSLSFRNTAFFRAGAVRSSNPRRLRTLLLFPSSN
jgi:hypothetical protein